WFPRELSGDEPFRWVDNNAELVIPPSRDLARVLLLDVEPGPGVNMGTFLLEIVDETGGCVSSAWVTRRNIVTLPVPASITEPVRIRLHTKRGGMRISSDPRTLNFR